MFNIFYSSWKTLFSPLTGGSVNDPDTASRFRDSIRGGGSNGGGGGGRFDGPGLLGFLYLNFYILYNTKLKHILILVPTRVEFKGK